MARTNDAQALRRLTVAELGSAVHRAAPLSREGVLERLFTFAFRGLVYPQIWEDPEVDLRALSLGPDDHVLTIASGGCNALSYLVGNPARITAVDLNGAHVALVRLKLAAARALPDHASFRRFFANANNTGNPTLYDRYLAPALDRTSRIYWERRNLLGRRRIDMFARGFYRYGLLGWFIGAGHALARLHGVNPAIMLTAKDRAEQQHLFDTRLAPLLEKPFMRWLLRQPASLYGLGIPPAQYRALSGDNPGGIGAVLRQRLEKLACGFDISSNYFAWQAFGRGYQPTPNAATPPYLDAQHFDAVRNRADRINVVHGSITATMRERPAASLDAYVLLDAQDWMNDYDLTELWTEITRTAKPGARVIFRTAANERLLPGRIPQDILGCWDYNDAASKALDAQDRSSIYGAFHLYTLKAAEG